MNDLGVYIGPATAVDAIQALSDHTPGEWVMQLTDPNGEVLWRKNGWSWSLVENDTEAMFAMALHEQGAGNPSMYADAPLVLSFAKAMKIVGSCDLYSGGLVFKFGFGDYQGHTLTMIAWHGVLHETQTGHIAPGFGGFEVVGDEEVEDAADDEERDR